MFKVNDKVDCVEYGKGVVLQLCDYELMLVKFESRELKTMCSQKGFTVHDDKKRKVVKV